MIRKRRVEFVEGLLSLCLMIHAYANGGNWRYTVERYACAVDSITTKYEYSAPAPAGALTREQLESKLDQLRRDDPAKPESDSAPAGGETI
jgi:hypothetical protein